MLKFFRQIRQRLLSENKFSKYLFYAVGEIMLVVIGILIALQVNNWKEYRAQLNYQDTVLNEIKEGLESDIRRFEDNLETLRDIDSGVTSVVDIMERDSSEIDLKEFYQAANKTVMKISFGYNAGAYEGLKSTGLEKIQNTKLRSNIINHYEISLKTAQVAFNEGNEFFEERQEEIRTTFNEDKVFESIFIPHEDSLLSIGMNLKPKKMLRHSLYPEYLKNTMWKSAGHRSQLRKLIQETEALILSIDIELGLR